MWLNLKTSKSEIKLLFVCSFRVLHFSLTIFKTVSLALEIKRLNPFENKGLMLPEME